MAILTQAAFASQLGAFLNGVEPLLSTVGDITICYDLEPTTVGNESLRQDLPNLISLPTLTKADEGHLRKIKDSYSSQEDLKRSVSCDEHLYEPYSLYEQLTRIRDAVDLWATRASELVNAVNNIDQVQPVLRTRANSFKEEASSMTENFDQAGLLSVRAGVLTCSVNLYYDTVGLFRKSAEFFERAHFYSSAAVLSELAAMVYESRFPTLTVDAAKKERSKAAKYWRDSLRYFNLADDDNGFVNGVKLLRGIVNGLVGETDFSDTTVDSLLDIASAWHCSDGENVYQANDLMYLAFRRVSRHEVLDSEKWEDVAKIIEHAAFIWREECVMCDAVQEAESLVAAAMQFANMYQS